MFVNCAARWRDVCSIVRMLHLRKAMRKRFRRKKWRKQKTSDAVFLNDAERCKEGKKSKVKQGFGNETSREKLSLCGCFPLTSEAFPKI
jgi:hypothetical protein